MLDPVASFARPVAPDNWERYLTFVFDGMRGTNRHRSALAPESLTKTQIGPAFAVAEAQAELDRMREEARADADRIIAQMREAAAAEVERVRKQGRDQILQYRRQMIRDLEQDLAAAMLALTEEKVREQIGSPQARADSIEKFLEDLEALANSGEAARRQPQTERK
ncbi:hypothetical protein [Nocardia sp. NPDC059239]|uniref:hypothetical protein n=1 Tax=unclassified Nocardia TaxID=2637762 RepID=UPI0036B68333